MTAARRPAFVASRALLRRLLTSATDCDRWDVSAVAGERPRARSVGPVGSGGAVPHRQPEVSLSHRLDWVAAAVAGQGGVGACGPVNPPVRTRVGIDIECERPVRSDPAGRAALMMSARECVDWASLPEHDREPSLLRAWVAKEAWFKAMPVGVAPWDFRRIEVRPAAPPHCNVRIWHSPGLCVGVSCNDPAALVETCCEAPAADDDLKTSFWRVDFTPDRGRIE